MAEVSRLGRYELRRILGQGSMGVVYEGFDPTLSRRVAVKTILKSHHLDPDTAKESICPWAHGIARFAHSPDPQPWFNGARWRLCRVASRYW